MMLRESEELRKRNNHLNHNLNRSVRKEKKWMKKIQLLNPYKKEWMLVVLHKF